MSNIRLNTIVPDVVNNPSGIINLPGSLSVVAFSCSSTLDATTPSNASVTFSGGLGLAKSLSLGGNISFSTTSSAVISPSTSSGSDNKGIVITGGGAAGSTRGASLELYGNQLYSGSVRIISGTSGKIFFQTGATEAAVFSPTGILTLNGTQSSTSATVGSLILSSGGVSVNNTTDATSVTSGGAVTIAGGMALGKSLYVGGSIVSSGSFSNSTGMSVTSVTDSTGLATGSIYTLGGAAISKSLFVGGNTSLSGGLTISGIISNTSTADNAVTLSGGMTIAKSLTVSGIFTGTSSASISGIVSLTNTLDSSGPTNGALVVSGGTGISSTLRVGGSTFIGANLTLSSAASTATFAGSIITTDTSDTTALNSGAFRISSGISVSKTARFGSNVFITGTHNVSGASALTSLSASGNVSITSATPSINVTSGALVVTGGFGLSGAMNSAGIVTLTNTTDSSGISTGSLVLTNGGLGVARSVNIGADLTVVGTSSFTGTVTLTDLSHSGVYTNTNSTASTSPTTGSALFSGGVGISGNLNLGSSLSVASTSTFTGNASFVGVITINNATDATSLTVASMVTSGGISVTKSLRVGTTATISGSTSISGVLTVLNATVSTSTSTGSVVISGGVGIAGAVNIGGSGSFTGAVTLSSTSNHVGVATFSNVTDATAANVGSVVSLGGIAAAKSVYVGTNLRVIGTSTQAAITASGIVSITNATASTATTNGALVVSGGTGIAGSINCGGNLTLTGGATIGGTVTFTNTTDSGNTTSGSAVFSGGVAITRNLNVGGGFSVGTTSLLAGAITNSVGLIYLNTVSISDQSGLLSVQSTVPGLRLAATDASKGTTYANSIDLFSLGNVYTDANHEALQIITQSTTGYLISSRALGTGVLRRVILQSGNNVNQVLLNTDGTVSLGSVTTDSLATNSGAVVISGGLGVRGSISLGKSLRLFGSTSGSVTMTAPAAVTSYSLSLPTALPSASNMALVSTTTGVLSWAEMTTSNPTFQSVSITNSTASTGSTTGALVVEGGIGAGGAGSFGGNLNLTGGSGANMVISTAPGVSAPTLTTRSIGTRFVIYPQISSTTADYAIGIESNHTWYSAANPTAGGHKWYSANRNTLTLDFNGNIYMYKGGDLVLAGYTSGTINITPPVTITSYTLTLPTALPSASNMALVSTTGGVLSWAEMITPNPTFQTVSITTATANTGLGTGALIVTGGGSIGAGLSLKGSLRLVGSTSGVTTLNVPATNASPTFTLPADIPSKPGQVLSSDSAGVLSWIDVPITGNYSAMLANNVTTPTAIIGLKFTSMFKLDVYVSLGTTTGIYGAMYTLRGFRSSAGWQLYQSYVGDTTGIEFAIDSVGQILYTSPNTANWTSSTISWSGPDVYSTPSGGTPQSFTGANNVPVPTNVTGLIFTPPQFSQYLLVTVNNSTLANSTTTLYQLQGTQQQTTAWDMTVNIVSGPDPGIRFSILSTGQVQYVSPNISGWLSTTFTFYGAEIPLQNSASYNSLTTTNLTTTNITSPKFKCTQIMNNTSGYPLSTAFTSSGGTLFFNCALSGFSSTAGILHSFTFSIDGTSKHVYQVYFNQSGTHLGWASSFVVTGISSGTHTFSVAFTGASDSNDRIDVTMTEYPF